MSDHDFSPYTLKVLGIIKNDLGITREALLFLSDFFTKLIYSILKSYKINSSLEDSIKKLVRGELAKYAITEGNKTYLVNSKICKSKICKSKNLMFNPCLIYKVIEDATINFKFSLQFVDYITAVLEYICGEILEVSSHKLTKFLTVEIIKNQINADEELSVLYERVILCERD